MAFYTSINRYGNSILYRGYTDNGTPVAKKVKFSPKLYVPVADETKHKAFDGGNLKEIQFDKMSEAKDFIDTYEGTDNFKIYGTTNYIHQFITDLYPNDIGFNINHINVVNFDIEVASDDGFPTPEEAANHFNCSEVK